MTKAWSILPDEWKPILKKPHGDSPLGYYTIPFACLERRYYSILHPKNMTIYQ